MYKINSYFYVMHNGNILLKDNIEKCIEYIKKIEVVKNHYYFIANCLEYDHPNNVDKMFNSYFTRFNNEYYDYVESSWKNHNSLLRYMDEKIIKKEKKKAYQTTIFDFLEEKI